MVGTSLFCLSAATTFPGLPQPREFQGQQHNVLGYSFIATEEVEKRKYSIPNRHKKPYTKRKGQMAWETAILPVKAGPPA
jgi:hypothetical protein